MAEQFEKFNDMEFFVDMQRCIGCHSCEMACAECETNGETSMIHIHYVDRAETIQTTVQVCMHCEDPICANVSGRRNYKRRVRHRAHRRYFKMHRLCELRDWMPVRSSANS